MVAASRAAWRDGSAQIDTITKDRRAYSVKVARAGASDEYLLWRLAPIERIAIESLAIELITGRIGRAMSGSGVMAVSVGPDGCVRAANAAFALRATGTDQYPLTGRSFVDFVRMDDKGSVFFEREGRRGLPIRLLHVPLNAHDVEGSALLLAVDEDSAKVDRGLALAHVEQLLSTLPLGLALVDRLQPQWLAAHHPQPQQGPPLHHPGTAPAGAAAVGLLRAASSEWFAIWRFYCGRDVAGAV